MPGRCPAVRSPSTEALTELDSEAELAAVLGHEIVHAAARHSAQSVQRGALLQAAVLVTGVAAADNTTMASSSDRRKRRGRFK